MERLVNSAGISDIRDSSETFERHIRLGGVKGLELRVQRLNMDHCFQKLPGGCKRGEPSRERRND